MAENKKTGEKANIAAIAVLAAGAIAAAAIFLGSPAAQESGTEAEKSAPARAAAYADISPAELSAMLAGGERDFLLVNVHIPYIGEIKGTDAFIPYNEIAERMPGIAPSREKKIVLYCQSGSMSAAAARDLVSLGYENVLNLSGGMIAWERSGFPLVKK